MGKRKRKQGAKTDTGHHWRADVTNEEYKVTNKNGRITNSSATDESSLNVESRPMKIEKRMLQSQFSTWGKIAYRGQLSMSRNILIVMSKGRSTTDT